MILVGGESINVELSRQVREMAGQTDEGKYTYDEEQTIFHNPLHGHHEQISQFEATLIGLLLAVLQVEGSNVGRADITTYN